MKLLRIFLIALAWSNVSSAANASQSKKAKNHSSPLIQAQVLRIARRAVDEHETITTGAKYKIVGRTANEWSIVVELANGSMERLIVLNRSGQVIHYYYGE